MSICDPAMRRLLELYRLGTGWRWLSGQRGPTLADGARIACGDFRASDYLGSVREYLTRDTRVLVLRGEGHCR